MAISQQETKTKILLELTQSINRNAPVSELLEWFRNSLQQEFGIKRCIIFLRKNNEWEAVIQDTSSAEIASLTEQYTHEKNVCPVDEKQKLFQYGFRLFIPVYHKDIPLALLFLGWDDGISERKDLDFITTLSHLLMVAIENKRLYKAQLEKNSLNKEIQLAADIQKKLLPSDLPYNKFLKVSGFYLPYQEVGGDYYDWIPLNQHEYLFCMADISGKGVPAALLMSNMQASLHSLVGFTHNLKDLIIELNKRIWESSHGEQFVSVFLGKINLRSQQITTINAGHCPGLYMENGKLHFLQKGTMLLGIQEHPGNIEVELREYSGEVGILLYTDGLSELEAHKDKPELFTNIVNDIFPASYKSPDKLIHQIAEALKKMTLQKELTDDIALLSVYVNDLFF